MDEQGIARLAEDGLRLLHIARDLRASAQTVCTLRQLLDLADELEELADDLVLEAGQALALREGLQMGTPASAHETEPASRESCAAVPLCEPCGGAVSRYELS